MALILQTCFAIPLNSAASPITRQQAQQNALNFLHERGKTVAVASLLHAPMRNSMTDEPQPYYVFNLRNNQGYVIASGDDAAYPVLGYSDEGFIDVNDIPCNLQAWLDGYARQIKSLQEHGATPSRAPKRTDYPPAIEPMLTCHWGQGYPYNMYCPIDPTTGTQCVTGCVATAMAQVMYYHRARSIRHTTIEITEYTTSTQRIHVDAIPAGSFIDWDNMVDNPNEYNTTEVQKQAIANLMKYCGTALRTDYTSSQSGAGMNSYELVHYFNYSPQTTVINRRNQNLGITDEVWESLIYYELKQNRPVQYALDQLPHVVVCDGYDGNGYYHINFGWGSGGADGFYLITMADGSTTMDDNDDFVVSSSCAIFYAEPLPTPPNDDQGNGIQFVDPNTRAICLWYADANGDWVLTENEAATVTDLYFTNTPIISFDEFKYFTGITSIRNNRFNGCSNLKSITIPNRVTSIGDYAFSNCRGLTSIEIPNSIESVGDCAFEKCTNLTEATINGGIIGVFAFYGCTSLKDLTVNGGTFRPQVFEGCTNLTDVTVNGGTIGLEAFRGSSLTDVTVNGGTIGPRAFRDCSLTDATVNGGTIRQHAFKDCSLMDVTINDGSIEQYAFRDCNGLANVTVNGGTIGQQAFRECSGLKKLTIGKSVTYIGDDAFFECSGLTDLIWNAQNCYYNGAMYTSSIERVTIGNEVEVLPVNFVKGSKITSISIPNSVTIIGLNAFEGCSSLKSISIPNSVNSCEGSLFYGCSNLKSVAIGKSVKDLGGYNFYGCDNLTSLYCLPLNPPNLYFSQFDNDVETNIQKFKNLTLYVPMEAVDAYKSTEPWCYFGNIFGLDPSLGDVNLDDEINIADINVIINSILSDNDDCLNEYMSDVNRDGEVNIADINTLIDKILSHH